MILIGGVFLSTRLGLSLFHLYGNQYSYFLYGIRLFDPNFIPNDWATWDMFHQHYVFGYLVYLLQYLGPLGIVAGISEIFLLCIFSYALYVLSKRYSNYPLQVWLFLIVFGAYAFSDYRGSSGLGWQVLTEDNLIAADVATVFMVLGLSFIFMERYLIFRIINRPWGHFPYGYTG